MQRIELSACKRDKMVRAASLSIYLKQYKSMFPTFIKTSSLQTARITIPSSGIQPVPFVTMDMAQCQIIYPFIPKTAQTDISAHFFCLMLPILAMKHNNIKIFCAKGKGIRNGTGMHRILLHCSYNDPLLPFFQYITAPAVRK